VGAAGQDPARRQTQRRVKFLVVAVGHRMPAWVNAGFDEYARRMPRESRIQLIEIKPESRPTESSPASVARIQEAEGKRLIAALPQSCLKVALDERGREASTRELAAMIEDWRRAGGDVAFLIGGADGLAAGLKADASRVWSLSKLTLPHGLVRVVLAEQLYRAMSVIGGLPYHRD
jgi:23S rRNA (pseudouridine1915-N3)-methyltransferase